MPIQRTRWHPRTHKAMSRPVAKPLPAGVTLEDPEPRTHTLPCIGCDAPVKVTGSYHAAVVRLGLPWGECSECAAMVAEMEG